MSAFRLKQAARSIHAGGIIAYPTEAVFGLGCDPLNPDAVCRVLELKQRPVAKGLILVAADFAQLRAFVRMLPPARMQEILASWPGPNTWLFPSTADCPAWLTGSHDTLAVRVTAHPVTADLCRAARMPLVSTSANLAGHRPFKNALQVRSCFRDRVDTIVSGVVGTLRAPTAIRDGATGTLIRGA